MVFWVVDQCFIMWGPHIAVHPHVDRLVVRQPAKSVSAYTVMCWPPVCHGKWCTARGRCSKYRAKRRS
eukprot:3390964-Alexandrium_andersonii.AAC.1